MAGIGGVGAGVSAGVSAPVWLIDLPPGRILPEKASVRLCERASSFDWFTLAIENMTMKRAISSVIMSA
jgi:hypothetical protein